MAVVAVSTGKVAELGDKGWLLLGLSVDIGGCELKLLVGWMGGPSRAVVGMCVAGY